MEQCSVPPRRGLPRMRTAVAVAVVLSLTALTGGPRAEAAGLNLAVPMGQRFVGSASPAKSLVLPLATKVGPIRALAIAGIQATTFSAIKDPVLGITIFSSSEVKQIVLDTVNNLGSDVDLAFKINSLDHPDKTDFTIGGNCVGADGATTPLCIASVVFKPASPGPKTDPISAQISITRGMDAVESALHAALDNQGVKGAIVNIIYPLLRSYVQNTLTDGLESALLAPVATASGTGVAGPFTDPTVFIKRQYADFFGGTPSSAQISTWVKNFEGGGAPAGLTDALRKASAWDGKVGPVTRLYSAYFLRSPDNSGIKYWVNRSRNGTRLTAISSTFAASSEFQRRYGALSNADFVKLVYQNVLGRQPDSGGLDYWTRQMKNGKTRGQLMVGFSESSEYIRKQAPSVTVVEIWWGMLHRAPSAAEIAGYGTRIKTGTPATTIITEVLASTEYRSLVLGSA
jgi:hypothetical protein